MLKKTKNFIEDIKERSHYLHDFESFKEKLLMPMKEFIPHDAAGITEAKGVGFDSRAIYYGFPPGYIRNWTNQDPKKVSRWKRYFTDGAKRGYLTLRSTDFMENFDKTKEYKKFYQSYGQRDSIQSIFLSNNGSPMGVCVCNRFSEKPLFTVEERELFDTISPHIFCAYRNLVMIHTPTGSSSGTG